MSVRFNEKRYNGLHFHENNNEKKIQKFESILGDEKCNVFDRIKVIQRIGSDSIYATVWEVDFSLALDLADTNKEKIKMAIKVQNNVDKSLDEIDINNFLQNIENRSYFLRFYGNIYCENIELLKQSFNGYFMFMELAIGDLAQYIQMHNVSEKQLIQFIIEVYNSIYMLDSHQIYHGDLHLRNAFIVKRDGENHAVIGDFGETKATDSITAHTSDIVNFSSSLLIFLKSLRNPKYGRIEKKLAEIIKTVNRMTPVIEESYDGDEEKFDRIVKSTIEKIIPILNY